MLHVDGGRHMQRPWSQGSLQTLRQASRQLSDKPSRRQANGNSNKQHYQMPFEVAYKDICQHRNFRRLQNLFLEADADGSRGMSLDEFRSALRKPNFQRSFSILGVQPHQAEIVFKAMKKTEQQDEEISIDNFMGGLQKLVGGAVFEGPPVELDVHRLRPSSRAKERSTASKGLSRSDCEQLLAEASAAWRQGEPPPPPPPQQTPLPPATPPLANGSQTGSATSLPSPSASRRKMTMSLSSSSSAWASVSLATAQDSVADVRSSDSGLNSRSATKEEVFDAPASTEMNNFTHAASVKALHSALAHRRCVKRVA
eukprot:TRINITY_DN28061_c0_g1_i1.p1 TRINITY_DN28061_c0_g1~~TRINITY_DN28061_c0_g1_i1.p1  ORF type:complete len:313 (-),score=51.73 TRINITY_DN28061_c0_g1_i1:27-965(-)